MVDSSRDQLDRYLAGELSRQDQRKLALEALDDPELFDELTAAAVVKSALNRKGASVHWFKRTRVALMLGGIAAAAAAIVALVTIDRSSSNSVAPPEIATTTPSPGPNARPVATVPFQPVFLSARAGNPAGQSVEFRSATTDARLPKDEGVVVSIDKEEVSVDLGSLDGLAKGAELRLFRGSDSKQAIGRLTITTVFRERSRGRAAGGAPLQAGDRVEVTAAMRVSARGEAAEAMNERGIALIERKDYVEAERILRGAQPLAVGAPAVHVANNLAGLAALRGDLVGAETMYRSALALAEDSPDREADRRAIEKNLEALRASP